MNERKRKEALRKLITNYHAAFATNEAKRVLDHLSEFCHENELTFTSDNQYMTAYNEGKRSVILQIRRLIGADPNDPVLIEGIENG